MSALQTQSVRTLFDSIARRYDLLNHLLSGGVDFYWRRQAVARLQQLRTPRILDVATGTADFAIAALRCSPREVVGIDIAGEMLRRGDEKLRKRGLDSIIRLQSGDVQNLEFQDAEFDAAIVAFGARNFEDLHRGLSEMHRVLRPGGVIVVLEFSKPRTFPFKQLYFFYFLRILPFIGRMISGSSFAYTYLPDTVMKFPEGKKFTAILEETGFHRTQERRLTFGIVSIYSGVKPDSQDDTRTSSNFPS